MVPRSPGSSFSSSHQRRKIASLPLGPARHTLLPCRGWSLTASCPYQGGINSLWFIVHPPSPSTWTSDFTLATLWSLSMASLSEGSVELWWVASWALRILPSFCFRVALQSWLSYYFHLFLDLHPGDSILQPPPVWKDSLYTQVFSLLTAYWLLNTSQEVLI